MGWRLCKGRSIKTERIGKRKARVFSKQFISTSGYNGKSSLLLQLLGRCCCAKSLQCHRPFGSSVQSGWMLTGGMAGAAELFYS